MVAELDDEGHRAISLSGWVAGPPATNGQVPKIPFSCTRATRDGNAPWTGKIPVQASSPKGVWVVQLLRVQDNSLGWKDYTPADPVLSQAKFEVR